MCRVRDANSDARKLPSLLKVGAELADRVSAPSVSPSGILGMLALLLAAPSLALLPRHSKLSCSRPTAVAPRAPPLVAQERRLRQALRGSDEIDGEIMGVALPSIANFAVIPLVGAVDTMWVGRMGSALALAGQGAAGQCFFSTYFLIAFIPTITAPLVAAAAGSGDIDSACKRVCEALFLANALGVLGALRAHT